MVKDMNVFVLNSGDDHGEGWHTKGVYTTLQLAEEAKAKWIAQDDYGLHYLIIPMETDPSLDTIPDPYVWDDEVDLVVYPDMEGDDD